MPDRRYTKPDPVAEDVIVVPDESQADALAAKDSLTRTSATKYSKAENVLQPKAFVVVFSNGEVREKNYFQWMMYHCTSLRLEFFSDPVSPDDMLEGVRSKKEEYVLTAGEETPDSYYLVTDVDHFYNVILRCQSDYDSEGIGFFCRPNVNLLTRNCPYLPRPYRPRSYRPAFPLCCSPNSTASSRRVR